MKDTKLEWKVNTPALLEEIVGCGLDKSMGILYRPVNILRNLLIEVADRAIQINDPELNILMLRLALYEEGDPYSKDYNPDAIRLMKERISKRKKK